MKHDDKTINLLKIEGYSFCTDITLRGKTKERLVEKIRILENNWAAAIERCENQRKLLEQKEKENLEQCRIIAENAFYYGCEMEKAVRQDEATREECRAFEVYKIDHPNLFTNNFSDEEKRRIEEEWNSHEYENEVVE